MVIELVSLKVKENIKESDFLRAAEASNIFLSGCTGFVRRRLAKSEAGDWVDYVEWQSLGDALSAAQRFSQAPETRDFNSAIEPGSVVMRHLTIRSTAN